jgi:hypothetical protein
LCTILLAASRGGPFGAILFQVLSSASTQEPLRQWPRYSGHEFLPICIDVPVIGEKTAKANGSALNFKDIIGERPDLILFCSRPTLGP